MDGLLIFVFYLSLPIRGARDTALAAASTFLAPSLSSALPIVSNLLVHVVDPDRAPVRFESSQRMDKPPSGSFAAGGALISTLFIYFSPL
jgi:hypothetical protein